MDDFKEYIITPFLEVINKFGNRSAFCIDNKLYTYTEFAKNISKIRYSLRDKKIKSKNIGIVANDDIETYASIFAVWLEGYAYVPLHPKQPIERTMEVIYQADIEFLLDSISNNVISEIKQIQTSDLIFTDYYLTPNIVEDNNLAYILFTSGSTGKPKGVPITRASIGSFIKSFLNDEFEIDHNDKCLQSFDLTFDVSIQAFLTPILRGACAFTIPHNQIKYSYVYGLFDEHDLTFSVMAPSMLRYLRPYFGEMQFNSMKYCVLTAEASPIDLVQEWSKCIPNASIYNFYGPTEATIYCTYMKFNLNSNNHLNGMLSIGKPMNGIEAIILDENGDIITNSNKGELCISGKQLTKGYWKNDEKTSESFFEMEFKGQNRRFYRTGDLCCYNSDGQILYSGRLDYQVKIQGYRVELGEIEFHARNYLHGKNAIATVFANKSGNNEIALFVEDEVTESGGLYEYLKQKLPTYMIPTKVIFESRFPINTNGKIDRNLLKKRIVV